MITAGTVVAGGLGIVLFLSNRVVPASGLIRW